MQLEGGTEARKSDCEGLEWSSTLGHVLGIR
jgi:hypothetical protein